MIILNLSVVDWKFLWEKAVKAYLKLLYCQNERKFENNSGRDSKPTPPGADSFAKWFPALKAASISNTILRSFQSCIGFPVFIWGRCVTWHSDVYNRDSRTPQNFSYLILITNCVNNCFVDYSPFWLRNRKRHTRLSPGPLQRNPLWYRVFQEQPTISFATDYRSSKKSSSTGHSDPVQSICLPLLRKSYLTPSELCNQSV
jgi:hypothetical protein